jgi:hypothetical protein
MDRLLALQEQVTTANRVDPEDPNSVERELLADAGELLPEINRRILRRGWNISRDLLALGVVLSLLIGIILTGRAGAQFSLAESEPIALPVLDQQPDFEDVFPSGIPGLSGVPDPDSQAGPESGDGAVDPNSLGELDNILSDLGETLSEHPETAAIGEALENGDLEGAAAAIERTADSVDLLPEDARQNMQQALEQAAQQAQQAGQQDLAEDLQAAAQALENTDPNNPMAADALDELAEDIRNLGEAFASMGQPGAEDGSPPPANEPQVGSAGGASGSGSGAGAQDQGEPLIRLEGEGEEYTLEGGDDPSGLLQPASSSGTPTSGEGGTAAAGGGSTGGGDCPLDQTTCILTPYSFPWNWRDVVSDYFSP